jgi:formate dehydrogenase
VDEICVDHPERIRALIVSGGNPAHSIPGGRFGAARDQLDLLVAVDLYLGETASMADYVLPAADVLEHSDFPIGWIHLQETPYAQFTRAVVAPKFERRPEWRIYSDLALASGLSPFGTTLCNGLPWLNAALRRLPGAPEITPDHLVAALLWWGGRVSMRTLRDNPSGVLLQPNRTGALARAMAGRKERVVAAPPALASELARFEAGCEASPEPNTLQIIGLRERRTHNSWLHNHPSLSRAQTNHLRMHPDDAKNREIGDGELVRVCGAGGHIEVPVRVTDRMMPGVVALPHGWDHRGSSVDRAKSVGGANINTVLGGGARQMESLSGQARMTGQRVTVVAASGAAPH